MNTPKLEIYLNQDDYLCIAKVEQPNDQSRLIVDIPMSDINALSYEEASTKIGGSVLHILRLWHKEAFENLSKGTSIIDDSGGSESYEIALRLVSIALDAKTTIYSTSIDSLLEQAALTDVDARNYLENAWPLLRERLEK